MPGVARSKSYQWAPVSPGLVAPEWRWFWHGLRRAYVMDEGGGTTIYDLAERSPATFSGTVSWVPGQYGSSIAIGSAATHRIDLTTNAYDLGIRRHATFAGLIRATAGAAFHHPLISDWNTSLGFNLRFDATSGRVLMYIYPNNHRATSANGLWELNTWYWLVGVMDGANMYIYLDGKQVATQTLGEDIGDSASPMRIGTRGDMDDPKNTTDVSLLTIHDVALSAAQIRYLAPVPFGPFHLWLPVLGRAPLAVAARRIFIT